jgi:uncharacterized protein (TIGR00255 family)
LLRSMTAFARGQSSGENEDFLIEIHSVNSRRLEIATNLPGELTEFDAPLRKLVNSFVTRGRVSVYLSMKPNSDGAPSLEANVPMARQIKSAYDQLKTLLGYEGQVDFSIIASRPDLILQPKPPADPEQRWKPIESAARAALAALIAMKEAEGQNLRSAFDDCLAELDTIIASIGDASPTALDRHTQKLKEKIRQAAPDLTDNEDRILREIVILADKLDISEEIERLKSHIRQFRELMDDPKPCGRTMDFLIQEMNREVNTIGAKAADLSISQLVVHAKTELERMREQAQNIE